MDDAARGGDRDETTMDGHKKTCNRDE